MTGRLLRRALVIVIGVAVVAAALMIAGRPRSADEREAAARDLVAGIEVSVSDVSATLGTTTAIADFGLERGIEMVRVRNVEALRLRLRIEAARDVVLRVPPRVCLAGPFWNPLDAGLESRCWGTPDLGLLLAAELPRDADGYPTLPAGTAFIVDATLARGDVRCDYPPGEWHLQVDVEPIIDRIPLHHIEVADIVVDLPWEGEPITISRTSPETRFCSYTDAIYRRQGEPPSP
jgi:hypothetical protein